MTDRCNFRCTYCMPVQQSFMPRKLVLSYEEIVAIVGRFADHGVRRIRLTGGEPMVRRDFFKLVDWLGDLVKQGRLDELTLTTNGSLLADNAQKLVDAGIKRINVSLDTLDAQQFAAISRGGDFHTVVAGIKAARDVGLAVRLNMVALRGVNEEQLLPMLDYAAKIGASLAIIETMPLGQKITDREDTYIDMDAFLQPLHDAGLSLQEDAFVSAGPARYYQVAGVRLGVITPLSTNFCDSCNRLRLSADGRIHPCLGSPLSFDLKTAFRETGIDGLDRILQKSLALKPQRHEFEQQLANSNMRMDRHMNVLGG